MPQPTISQQVASLKAANADLEAHNADLVRQVDTLTKELANTRLCKSFSDERSASSITEIEQAHALLDLIAGCPGREYEVDGACNKLRRQLVTRLAGVFLVLANPSGVK